MGERDRAIVRKAVFTATVLAVAALVALTPAFACTANGALLKVTPGKAAPGAPVTIIGEMFEPTGVDAGQVTIRWNGPSGVPLATADVDAEGVFQVQIAVPADTFGGFYPVNATQWLAGGEAKKPSVTVEVLGPPAPADPGAAAAQPPAPAPAPTAPAPAPAVDASAAPAAPVTAPAVPKAATPPRAPAATPAVPAPVEPAPAESVATVEATPPAPDVAPAVPPPVVAPGAVTADLWSGFGTIRSPAWASRDATPAPAGPGDASRLWTMPVIAGLVLVGAGAVGLVRRPRALAAERTSED